MKALLLTEYMNLQVTELAAPEIGAADVLVRVRACGICGSDVHGLDGRTGRRIPPLVMGHEALTPAWRPICASRGGVKQLTMSLADEGAATESL